MTAFATVAELGTFTNRDIADGDAAATLALELASDAVRAWCRQQLHHVTGDTITVDSTGTSLLLLPETPVTAVTAVVIDGTELDSDSYTCTTFGALRRTGGRSWPAGPVTVTYNHGYETTPGAVRAATLAVAARLLDTPAGVRQETIGTYSVTYTNATPALADAETRNLEPYRVA